MATRTFSATSGESLFERMSYMSSGTAMAAEMPFDIISDATASLSLPSLSIRIILSDWSP